MANINLRLYGEQIYPNISKYLTKYIAPEITKEDFTTMYKNGHVGLKQISLKESINIFPQIEIEEASISSLEINIPDEKENFGLSINDMDCLISISEMEEKEIEKLLIEEKKKLIDDFINYSFKKVLKKDGASFIDNLIKSVVEKIINGMTIDIKNLKLKIRAKNRDNIYFAFLIENTNYSIDKGVTINNMSLTYCDDLNKINILEKFDIIVDIKSSEEKETPNKININLSDAILTLNKNVFLEFSNIFDMFEETKYKKIYLKYKKLIQTNKTINKENENDNILNLTDEYQIKIIENYIENNNLVDDIYLSEDSNALKATKKKVEKKILDDKNSNVLANAFSFFFGGNKDEKKNELTDEEKKSLEEIYQIENINKFLNNEIETTNNFDIIFDKIKSFLSIISFKFEFSKLQLNVLNENRVYDINFFISSLRFNLNYIENQFDFNFIINDIGYKIDDSFFKKRTSQSALEINRDRNNYIEIKLGFENVEIKIDEFFGLFLFLNLIKIQKRQKIFYNKLDILQERQKENKKNENYNQIINNITNFSFANNFKISNIPSLSIWIKEYKIDINIFNYSLNENSINFTVNINDSNVKILNDLSFNIVKTEKNITCTIETPFELNIKSDILLNIITNYFEYIKEISKKDIPQINNKFPEIEDNLFEFKNVPDNNFDFGNIDFNEYKLIIIIKKIDLKIYKQKNELENSFLLDNVKISYEKKNLNIVYNKCILTTDFKSNLFSFLIKSEFPLIEKDDIKEKEEKIKTKLNYNDIMKNFLNKFVIKGKTINIILNSENLLISINFNNITIYQENNNIQNACLSIDNWNCSASLSNSNNKNKNIFKSDEKSLIKYDMISKIIKIELEFIYINASFQIINHIYNDFSFLFKESKNKDNLIEKNSELLKIEFNLNNFSYEIENKYFFYTSKISIKNFGIKENELSIFYMNMNKISINNLNKATIIYTEQLNIDCNLSVNEKTKMNLNCDEIFFNLSKNEFLFFSSMIKQNRNKDYNKFYSGDMGQKINNKKILFTGKTPLKSKTSLPIMINKKGNKTIEINFNIKKIELSLCKNDNFEKIIQLSMNILVIKSIINLDDEISLSNKYNQYLSVQDLNLIYNDKDKGTYNLLTKKKEAMKQKQLEIVYGNNNCEIDVMGNEINLRFDLFFVLYYYFEDNDSLKKSYIYFNEGIDIKKCIKLCFLDSKFQLSTSFEGKENLFLDINNFTVIYNNTNCKFPYGTYDILLDKLSSNIILKNNTRKLFKTGDNFLSMTLNYYEEIIIMNITIGSLLINLSYRDFVSFLRAYQLNLKLINSVLKNKENLISEENSKNEIKREMGETPGSYTKKSGKTYTGKVTLNKSINLKLIDDSKGTYQPFLNFDFENFSLDFDPENTFMSQFYFRLSSYNYIACVWEPVIEKLLIKSNGTFKDIYKIEIGINSLLINLSDMAISFTLITFDRWLTKLELKRKKFENKEIKFNYISDTGEGKEFKNIKISNNQIINYTGIELNILYNGKQIKCPPLQNIYLDNSDLEEIEDMKKSRYITLLYDNEHKFEIPTKRIINMNHQINNNLFIISENSLSENKTINISLYSPIVIRNKTPNLLKVNFSNNDETSEIFLEPNKICGVPLNLIDSNTYFWFYLLESNNYSESNRTEDFNLNKILNSTSQLIRKIQFADKTFYRKINTKFNKLREITLYSEFNIINCLPCEMEIEFYNKSCKIEKCSQYYITENYKNNLYVILSIETDYGKFSTDRIDLLDRKNIGNFLKFKKKDIGKKFKLPCIFKINEEEKMLIIYSELIVHNRSGLQLNIDSSDGKYLVCFCVKDNINMISSCIDYKDEKLLFRCGKYFSKSIKIHKLIQITTNMTINMLYDDYNNPFNIIIKKKTSLLKIDNNPNFKEQIISIVFSIFPMCRIFNLLSTKRFIIYDYENLNKQNSCFAIEPFQTAKYYFFNKGENVLLGITALNLNSKIDIKKLVKLQFKIGIYTLMADNFIYSLDIKRNPTSGCLDVYILENDINNSQTIVENLSNELITIYQKNYEKNMQILNPNELVPLNIYNFYNKNFIFESSNSMKEINFKQVQSTINDKNDKCIIQLNNQIIIVFQDNGIKMKITFYSREKYEKAESNIIKIYYELFIKSIYISVIGDNEIENPKLTNYKRYELLLIYLYNFGMHIEQTIGLLNRNLIKTKLIFDKLRIYNQLDSQFKFICILKNSQTPCLQIINEINYYGEQKIININKQEIFVQRLFLGIDPEFFRKYLKFYDNVLYRMDLTYKNVNKIFLNNIEFDPKKLIKKHRKGRILVNAKNLHYPELKVQYELVGKNLEILLKERLACSDFYIWAAKGLVGNPQELTLQDFCKNYTNGTIVNYFIWLYYLYEEKIEDNLTEVGMKGILGQFKNFLTFDLYNEDEKNKYNTKGRLREIRPFYGKFKFFIDYDSTDANLIKKTFIKNEKFMMNQYYPIKIIKEEKSFYLFTNIAMFNINSLNYNINWNVDYFVIKYSRANDFRVQVFYNQKIDKYESCSFKCQNNKIAQEVSEILNEESLKNNENKYEI